MLPPLLHRRLLHSILRPPFAPAAGAVRLLVEIELDPTIDIMVEATWIILLLLLCAMLFETVALDDKDVVFRTKMISIVARAILSHNPTLPN
jgi:hypothetical protein